VLPNQCILTFLISSAKQKGDETNHDGRPQSDKCSLLVVLILTRSTQCAAKNHDQWSSHHLDSTSQINRDCCRCFLSFFSFVAVWCQGQGVRVSKEWTASGIGILQWRHLEPCQSEGITSMSGSNAVKCQRCFESLLTQVQHRASSIKKGADLPLFARWWVLTVFAVANDDVSQSC
jgi:hypothetical protein